MIVADADQISFHTAAGSRLESHLGKADVIVMAFALGTSFWKIVEDCLVAFHNQNASAAQKKVCDYRERLADEARQFGPDWMEDLVYHAEPWQLACDLTGVQLDLNDYRAEYETLQSRNGLIGFNLQPIRFGQNSPSFIKV